MTKPKVLVMSGSARTGSFNRKLAALAAEAAQREGAEVTVLDLRALGLPLYDADDEAAALPAGALELRRVFAAHQAVLISAPEYNSFVTPLLVNSFAWLSRVPAGEGQASGLGVTAGKPTGLLSASPGALGGLRGLIFLRSFLSANFGMLVVPDTHSVSAANQAFDEQGKLTDAKHQAGLERVVRAVVKTATALGAIAS